MYHMEWDAPITYTEGGIATHCMGIELCGGWYSHLAFFKKLSYYR